MEKHAHDRTANAAKRQGTDFTAWVRGQEVHHAALPIELVYLATKNHPPHLTPFLFVFHILQYSIGRMTFFTLVDNFSLNEN